MEGVWVLILLPSAFYSILLTLRVLVGAVGGGYGKRDSATNGLPIISLQDQSSNSAMLQRKQIV